jgi:hypothetical protein
VWYSVCNVVLKLMELITKFSPSGKTKYFGVRLPDGVEFMFQSKKQAAAYISYHEANNDVSSNIQREFPLPSGEQFSPGGGDYSKSIRDGYIERCARQQIQRIKQGFRRAEQIRHEQNAILHQLGDNLARRADQARKALLLNQTNCTKRPRLESETIDVMSTCVDPLKLTEDSCIE